MKILVTGSSGLVGTALVSALARRGHTLCRLVRPQGAAGEGVGSGSAEGRGAGDSRGAGALRDYFGARGRCAAEDDAAIQIWRWGKAGFRAAVDVVGDARRPRRDFAIRD